MGPHPVPQNVTSFQFKLIGDMNIKQFIYLATGVGIAYLIFILFVSSYPLVAWPMIVISASMGAAFAFLPVGSRPLDKWVVAFFKSIYSPTLRYWAKNGKTYKEEEQFNNRYLMFVSGFRPIRLPSAPVRESLPPQMLNDALKQQVPAGQPPTINQQPTDSGQPAPTPAPVPEDLPTSEELKKTVELAKQAQALQVKIIQTERTLNQIKTATNQATPIPVDYTHEVAKILTDLQKLITQANEIRAQMDAVHPPVGGSKEMPKLDMKQLRDKIKVVIPEKTKQTQIALTTFPNVISGIVKDISNNYLSNVVAVIYDKEGLPVRALKTNKLGQFTGSTPLSNGTYTLELEKDGYTFDVLQIQLDGQVMPPLSITAKQ